MSVCVKMINFIICHQIFKILIKKFLPLISLNILWKDISSYQYLSYGFDYLRWTFRFYRLCEIIFRKYVNSKQNNLFPLFIFWIGINSAKSICHVSLIPFCMNRLRRKVFLTGFLLIFRYYFVRILKCRLWILISFLILFAIFWENSKHNLNKSMSTSRSLHMAISANWTPVFFTLVKSDYNKST